MGRRRRTVSFLYALIKNLLLPRRKNVYTVNIKDLLLYNISLFFSLFLAWATLYGESSSIIDIDIYMYIRKGLCCNVIRNALPFRRETVPNTNWRWWPTARPTPPPLHSVGRHRHHCPVKKRNKKLEDDPSSVSSSSYMFLFYIFMYVFFASLSFSLFSSICCDGSFLSYSSKVLN